MPVFFSLLCLHSTKLHQIQLIYYDPRVTKQEVQRTAELIRDIARDRTIIVVEHDMQFIRMIAERVTVFHQGRILAEDTMDAIMADERVRDVYLGKQAGAA